MKETSTNFFHSFCLQRPLYLKYCNTVRSTVSQSSSSIVKINLFCLVPTARFEDIYFADHYNYIFLFFVVLSTTWQTGKTFGRCWCMCNGNSTLHDSFGIRPRGGVFSYFVLEGRRFKRTDTSMWCINESYQEIWAVSARPKPPNSN